MAYHPFRHLGLKGLAVAIALALWFAVAGEQTVERSLRAPLELQNKPEQFELVENPPAQIDVRVRGASSLLSHLQAGDIVAVLDLTAARPGRKIFHLTPRQIQAPFGVEVTQVVPGSISLLFESSQTKTVPVVPVVEGDPAPGYAIGQITSDPVSVEVVGPESALLHLKDVTTEPVSVAGATRRVREVVSIGVNDSNVRLKALVSGTVTVQITPAPIERRLGGVQVRVRDLRRALRAQIEPREVAFLVRGPSDAVDRLLGDGLEAHVDLAGLGPGRYNLPVRAEPPQNVVILQTDPASIRVRIR